MIAVEWDLPSLAWGNFTESEPYGAIVPTPSHVSRRVW